MSWKLLLARSRFVLKSLAAAPSGNANIKFRLQIHSSDSLVLKLADGTMMKLTTRNYSRPEQPFDIPVLASGVQEVDGRAVKYFIQPEAQPATRADLADFLKTLTSHGFRMIDPGVKQIGIYHGRVKLLDPYAVDAVDAVDKD